jgi:hypothetical protein
MENDGYDSEERAPGPGEDPFPFENADSNGRLPNPGRPWRPIALVAAGAAVTIAGTVVATLAATHRTAVLENAKAYAHGMHDALSAAGMGIDPFEV